MSFQLNQEMNACTSSASAGSSNNRVVRSKSCPKISKRKHDYRNKSQAWKYLEITGIFVYQMAVLIHMQSQQQQHILIRQILTDYFLQNNSLSLASDSAANMVAAVKNLKLNLGLEGLVNIRCCAHVINLVVDAGLISLESFYEKIRYFCKKVSYVILIMNTFFTKNSIS